MSFFSRILGGGRNAMSGGGGGQMPQFQPGPNPASAAMPYLNQIPGIGQQYYQPFISGGQQAASIANPIYNQATQASDIANPIYNQATQASNMAGQQYNQMTQNPNDFLNSIMRNYNPSEGYRFKENRLKQQMANDAAAGGFRGTQYDQEQQGHAVSGILGQDMEQFLSNILGIQGRGLQGQENVINRGLQGQENRINRGLAGLENRINRGYESSGNLANYMGNALGTQGSLAFQGQAQQNQNAMDQYNAAMQQQNANRMNRNNRRSSLFGLLGTGGGALLGGMPGASIGGALGGLFGGG